MSALPGGGQACSACPPCVYCRGHHLPSLSLRISAGSHQPPHPPPCLPICLPTRPFFSLPFFSECHITQQHLCCHCVFLFRVSKNDFYCRSNSLRQRPLIHWGRGQNRKNYWEASARVLMIFCSFQFTYICIWKALTCIWHLIMRTGWRGKREWLSYTPPLSAPSPNARNVVHIVQHSPKIN